MDIIQDTTKPIEAKHSFGVNSWQRKKCIYDMKEFIVSPASSQEEGGVFFQLRYGKSNPSKTSTYDKITRELSQGTQGTSALMSLLGFEDHRLNRNNVGGAITVDASSGITFEDFSRHPVPTLDMPDHTLEAHSFPQAGQLITMPLSWKKHSLSKRTSITSESPSIIVAPNYDGLSRRTSITSENPSMIPVPNYGSLSRRNSITSETTSMISSPNYGSLPRRSSITSENSSEISSQNYRRLSRRNSISSENVSMMPAQNFGSLSRRNSITSENLSMISAPNYDSLSRRSSITSENPTVISAPNHRRLSRRASIPSENPSTIPAPNYESLSRRTSITSENPSAMYVPNAEELSRLTSIALENSSMIDTPNYESEEERDTVQDLRISTNEVRGYVASLAKHKNKFHYQIEDEEEEHEEIYEKEANNRIFRENERNTDAFNQDMELAHQNDKRSISNENSHINNINEKAAEDHTYDILYERYKPLAPTDDKNEYPLKEVKVESNKQENVTYKQEEVKELKTSLMDIVSPFIPFKETSRENEPTQTTQGELNEQKHTSKAVNRFFCNEIYEERKIPSTSEPDPDFSNNSRDSAYSGKAKVKKRRPKASKLREMNVWGPSSM